MYFTGYSRKSYNILKKQNLDINLMTSQLASIISIPVNSPLKNSECMSYIISSFC